MPQARVRIGGKGSTPKALTKSASNPSSYLTKNASTNLTAAVPVMDEGLCRTKTGMEIADLGISVSVTAQGVADRAEAKKQCLACPEIKKCQRYVLDQEKPAGSWGGVWGGLDPWNRQGVEVIQEKINDDKTRAKVIPYNLRVVVEWTEALP